jgi:hypothetical protein
MKKNETVNENMHSRVQGAGLLCLIFAANTSSEEAKKHFTASGKAFMEMAKMIQILSEIHDAESEGSSGTEPLVEEVKSIDPVVEPEKMKKDVPVVEKVDALVVEKLPVVEEYEILPPNSAYSDIGFVNGDHREPIKKWSTTEHNVGYEKNRGPYGSWVVRRRSDNEMVCVTNALTHKIVLYGEGNKIVMYDTGNIPKKIPRIECDSYCFIFKERNADGLEVSCVNDNIWLSYDENSWIVMGDGKPLECRNRERFHLKVKRGNKFTIYE